jgi:CheY-like chemotaxis protein
MVQGTRSVEQDGDAGSEGRPRTLPLRVVLAEDDTEVRLLLAHALRKDGHVVIEVASGHELIDMLCVLALDPFEGGMPDVVVSDIRMPGKSGLDVLEALHAVSWRTPFVLTTAFGDAATHARARAMGAFAVFDKPFDIDDLRTVVLNAGKLPRPGASSAAAE